MTEAVQLLSLLDRWSSPSRAIAVKCQSMGIIRSISVIIPTLNEKPNIVQAVHSVADADEVIVVDGGSQDGTCDMVGDLPCKLLHTSSGRGRQLDVGAREATGDVLLFLHADCWLEPRALGQVRELAQRRNGQPVFGAFRQRIDDSHYCFRWLEHGNAARATWCRLPYGDQGVFIDGKSYRACGGFADVTLMEDVMLARALAKRCRPVLLPGPIHLSPRRWNKDGVVRRTLQNWFILAAFYCGVSPERLARWYC